MQEVSNKIQFWAGFELIFKKDFNYSVESEEHGELIEGGFKKGEKLTLFSGDPSTGFFEVDVADLRPVATYVKIPVASVEWQSFRQTEQTVVSREPWPIKSRVFQRAYATKEHFAESFPMITGKFCVGPCVYCETGQGECRQRTKV